MGPLNEIPGSIIGGLVCFQDHLQYATTGFEDNEIVNYARMAQHPLRMSFKIQIASVQRTLP